jgi:hypothetical protein
VLDILDDPDTVEDGPSKQLSIIRDEPGAAAGAFATSLSEGGTAYEFS